ncbi:MAG: L,D-transpeptidase [Candidatus Cloacimonetes bacterium]|nr:L,D-transpeptidase [Candidatus Cloacimonadota bacterium]
MFSLSKAMGHLFRLRMLLWVFVLIMILGEAYCQTQKKKSSAVLPANADEMAFYPYIDEVSKRIITDYAAKHPQKLIVIDKTAMKLYFYEKGQLQTGYPIPIALGSDAVNPKLQSGDGRTPEGEFYLYSKVSGHSEFAYFMGISYPNKLDAERGLKSGLITKKQYNQITSRLANNQRPTMNTALGGEIGIHTVLSNSTISYGDVTGSNWTLGCIALEYMDMQKLFGQVKMATKVLIIGETYKKNHSL